MQTVLEDRRVLFPPSLMPLLPRALLEEAELAVPRGLVPEELHLRSGRCTTLWVGGQNLRLSYILTPTRAEKLLLDLCGGSLYAHEETLRCGYITLDGGVRVGLCGRAAVSGARVIGVSAPSGFVVRLPHPLPTAADAAVEELCLLLRELRSVRGVLLYAPPGVGKTTLLRAVAARMASGVSALRVALVDTREELCAGLEDPALLLDVLRAYPKGEGISIAVRTLGAQLLVCDEIGGRGEAEEILHAYHAGVPLLAAAHAGSVRELLARPGIRALHEAGCFGAYVGLSRVPGGSTYRLDITLEEALHDDL